MEGDVIVVFGLFGLVGFCWISALFGWIRNEWFFPSIAFIAICKNMRYVHQ